MISSDDWGFKTQTMISISHMRELLFPWQYRLVDKAHESGRYAILHSCGNFENILDDMIKIGFDAKHSYEDNIWSVEQAYPDFRLLYSLSTYTTALAFFIRSL